MLQRLAERMAPSSDSTVLISLSVDGVLGGRIAGNEFRVTVNPALTRSYAVVGRGTVTPTSDGCVVRGRIRRAVGFYAVFLLCAVFCFVGAFRFVHAMRDGELSSWRAWLDTLGMFLVGVLFMLTLVSRYFEERDTILGALRDAAGVT